MIPRAIWIRTKTDMNRITTLCAAALLATSATGAMAQSQGDWTLGLGLGTVSPKEDNGTVAGAKLEIDKNTQVTLTFEYFIADNLGIEVLAATPFTHDLELGGADIGEAKHLPPTLSINYHFQTKTAFTPFAGIGVNYTTALDVDSPLGDLELDDSWGAALHLGVDYAISDRGALRADLRWMDIDMDAELNGTDIGTAEVDPMVFGISYIMKF